MKKNDNRHTEKNKTTHMLALSISFFNFSFKNYFFVARCKLDDPEHPMCAKPSSRD